MELVHLDLMPILQVLSIVLAADALLTVTPANQTEVASVATLHLISGSCLTVDVSQ